MFLVIVKWLARFCIVALLTLVLVLLVAGIMEQTLDTSQRFNMAYHADCRDILRAMPDKCIDLIVADPPYGDGSSQSVNVERERERDCRDSGTDSDSGSTATSIRQRRIDHLHSSMRSAERETVTRTGGTWAEKYGKKS